MALKPFSCEATSLVLAESARLRQAAAARRETARAVQQNAMRARRRATAARRMQDERTQDLLRIE